MVAAGGEGVVVPAKGVHSEQRLYPALHVVLPVKPEPRVLL